ncbi:hypothetical protein SUGI_0744730 [Cryptomeria japonica]|nr:hypothetical protein SUGI_0744730 [Cryptomeria japonica]
MDTSSLCEKAPHVGVAAAAAVGIISLVWLCYHTLNGTRSCGPRVWPMAGMLPSVFYHLNDIYNWTTQMLAECEGTLRFKPPWMSNMLSLVTADPKNIEYILKTKFGSFPKGAHYQSVFYDLLGDGILNIDGSQWERARKSMSSIIHSPTFKDMMIHTIQQSVESKLLPLVDTLSRTGEMVDLQGLLVRFGLDNMTMLSFGVDLGSLTATKAHSEILQAIEEALDATVRRFILPSVVWKSMRYLGLGPEGKLKASLQIINGFVASVIACRRKKVRRSDFQGQDILSTMMRSEYEMKDEALRDAALNFVLAGRDTTSIALCWFFCLLSKHPLAEENILLEIRQIRRNRAKLSMEEVKEMHYLQAALAETLRLYPSLPINWKQARKEEVLPDGTRLKKGSNLIFPIYSMGRMEWIWGQDCADFKPERWLKGGVFVGEAGFKYPVFNAGPRVCLGKDFAFLQMKWVVASLLPRYRIQLLNIDRISQPQLGITLGFAKGLPVTIHPRH